MSLGTRARGTRGPARDRLRDSGGEGRALRASSAAAHGSGQPSWATPGPGKGAAAISVPGELPPRITLPYSSAPPSALASGNHRCAGAPSFSGAFSGESSRGQGRRGGWPRSLLALLAPGPSCWNPCGQPGSDHTSAGASQAPELRQEVAGIPALSLGSRLPRALRAGPQFWRGPGSRGHRAVARTAGRSSPSGVRGAWVPRRPQ